MIPLPRANTSVRESGVHTGSSSVTTPELCTTTRSLVPPTRSTTILWNPSAQV